MTEKEKWLTQEFVKEYFDYKEGFLYWKKPTSKHSYKIEIGARAGCLYRQTKSNRYGIGLYNKMYYASRLIFLWHHGYIPEVVDHINRNSLDDRIENLREANFAENGCNKRAQKNKSSQYLGVCFINRDRKLFCKTHNEMRTYHSEGWIANIRSKGKDIYLGQFKTEIEAALAYNKAAVMYHKEFANLNIIKP